MTKQQEFRKQTEEAKFEAFSLMCKKVADLEQEIRYECARCVYSDSPCIRSDYGVENDEDVCPNYKNVFTAYTQLKEENAKLKEENKKNLNDWLEACDKYRKVNLEQQKTKEQLEQAIKLLQFWVNDFYDNFNHAIRYEERHKALVETEQFLQETDIDNTIQKANEGLNLDKITEEVENDLKESCPDVLCEDCTKEDCIARKLGLIC